MYSICTCMQDATLRMIKMISTECTQSKGNRREDYTRCSITKISPLHYTFKESAKQLSFGKPNN